MSVPGRRAVLYAVFALTGAAARLGAAEGWLELPPDAWMPEADRRLLDG